MPSILPPLVAIQTSRRFFKGLERILILKRVNSELHSAVLLSEAIQQQWEDSVVHSRLLLSGVISTYLNTCLIKGPMLTLLVEDLVTLFRLPYLALTVGYLLVRLLLKEGANVNTPGGEYDFGLGTLVEILLDANADV
ncbi:hypothetical protein N7537_007598 [Penicillium hordei]|uniref:Uncharacterized protein n=1 Tax=Penicillium hordei TaxID=40994 RepID=A0AAD6H035_9EURO|nr:uncharacterized protein N7537_007598 [Penicillium hordei]KAJ5597514.1 hypothetical protein N7537_007598 [Penicillium hordei]